MKNLLTLIAILLLFTACGKKDVVVDGHTQQQYATDAQAATTAYVRGVQNTALAVEALTAKLSMDLKVGNKDVGLSGTLKMKRNDVIQLSLVMLFVEVARIEFSPKEVLIIDRVRKQYVRASYDEIDFLQAAGLNFNALQALFWHELFVPGEDAGSVPAQRFQLSAAGNHTLLSISDAPKLNYEFLTITKNHLIDRLTVEGKSSSERGKLVWKYADFTNVAGKQFPKKMSLSVTGLRTDIEAELSLSNIGTDSRWNGHTTPSDKYRQRTASEILHGLF